MTVYLWDASNYDWQRDTDHMVNFRAVRADGIAGIQHKATEGHTYTDPHFADFARLVNQGVGFAVVGPYHVAWPDDTAQWDHWFDTVEQSMPWWRDYPGVVNWQIDAEKFDNMPRQPNLAEIHAGVDRLLQRGGNDLSLDAIVTYAPKWLYGNTLQGLRTKLWSSDYGANPATRYRQAYPGDGSARWAPYSSRTPTLLQYGSRTIIGEQSTCDASAVRVDDEAALQALFTGDGDDMSAADVKAINDHTDSMLKLLWQAFSGQDNSVFSGGVTPKDTEAYTLQLLQYFWMALGGKDNSVFSGGTNLGDLEAKLAEQGAQLVTDMTAELQNAGITIAQPVVEAAFKNVLAKLTQP